MLEKILANKNKHMKNIYMDNHNHQDLWNIKWDKNQTLNINHLFKDMNKNIKNIKCLISNQTNKNNYKNLLKNLKHKKHKNHLELLHTDQNNHIEN